MRYFRFGLVLAALFCAEAAAQSYEPGQLYAIFNPGTVNLYVDSTGHTCCGIAYIDSVNRANNFSAFISAGCPPCSLMQNDFLIIFPETANIPALVAAYSANSNVKWASPNYLFQAAFTPNDPFFTRPSPSAPPSSYQWALDSNHLQMQKAWDITKGDTNVVIGILEQMPGFGWRHPDLEPNVWINTGEDVNHDGRFDSLDLNGQDDDGDGYADNVIGHRFRIVSGSVLCEPDPEAAVSPANACNGLHGAVTFAKTPDRRLQRLDCEIAGKSGHPGLPDGSAGGEFLSARPQFWLTFSLRRPSCTQEKKTQMG